MLKPKREEIYPHIPLRYRPEVCQELPELSAKGMYGKGGSVEQQIRGFLDGLESLPFSGDRIAKRFVLAGVEARVRTPGFAIALDDRLGIGVEEYYLQVFGAFARGPEHRKQLSPTLLRINVEKERGVPESSSRFFGVRKKLLDEGYWKVINDVISTISQQVHR